MKDFELYQQILGLGEPWRVESVSLKAKERQIEVRVGFADTLWGCPHCQERMRIHDYEERRWRHLDSCQFQTIIVSRVPVERKHFRSFIAEVIEEEFGLSYRKDLKNEQGKWIRGWKGLKVNEVVAGKSVGLG